MLSASLWYAIFGPDTFLGHIEAFYAVQQKQEEVERGCLLTSSPIEVRLMLSSWFCRPKLPATSTTIWRQVQGIVGRKSVTTNCRHWKAVRINISLKKDHAIWVC